MTAIETRFPISQERGHVKLSFPWYDAFRPSKKSSQANIHFEKAAVLFNIASVTSQQALQVERGTSDGCKQVGSSSAPCPVAGQYNWQQNVQQRQHQQEEEAAGVDGVSSVACGAALQISRP